MGVYKENSRGLKTCNAFMFVRVRERERVYFNSKKKEKKCNRDLAVQSCITNNKSEFRFHKRFQYAERENFYEML